MIFEGQNFVQSKSILNIQSHVVHGYVGNKSSTFPLQMLNWDVDVMNTVNFSNHTGYGSVKGSCATGTELLELYKGLSDINVKYDAILTGYVNGHETLEAVSEICIDIKRRSIAENRKLLWLLDPVMGDDGVLYVNENVIPVYRRILESQMVDIITPNQYELELLIGYKITCTKSLRQALRLVHEKYKVKHVVLSSLFANLFDDLPGGKETIYCCISSLNLAHELAFYRIEAIDGYFTGVGDLFSALLLDRISKSDDVLQCVNEVLSIMRKVLIVTAQLSTSTCKIGEKNMKNCELRVVECKNIYAESESIYEPIFLNKEDKEDSKKPV